MAAKGMSRLFSPNTAAASWHAASTVRASADRMPSFRSISNLLAQMTFSVLSAHGQKIPSTVRPSAARIGV
jgi:hypothetical protein